MAHWYASVRNYTFQQQWASIPIMIFLLLLGDRGYALAPWLMTPLTNPQIYQEISYNQRHVRTRSTIERTIGILKGRWMCLDTAGGKLLYKPEKVSMK